MSCLIALIIFSILGIFSASHRTLAKEAFDCIFRRITLRPCETGFNEKIRAKVVTGIFKRSQTAAKIINKHFEIVAWTFFFLSIISTGWVIRGGYNYYTYGSCNGLNSDSFCVFDPAGKNNKVSQLKESFQVCSVNQETKKSVNIDNLNIQQFPHKNLGQKNKLVFIGCYNCDYTRKTYPIIKKLVNKYNLDYTFIHFPVKSETNYLSDYIYCAYQQDKEKFWILNNKIFISDKKNNADSSYIDKIIVQIGFNLDKLKKCVNNSETKKITKKQFQEIKNTGIYGTPTIFINNKPFIGPKPERVYKRALGKFW